MLFTDYNEPLLKYRTESIIAEYEQEWLISSVYLQTNTKLHIETIPYVSRNQLKLFETRNKISSYCCNSISNFFLVCQHMNTSGYLFGITHFRVKSPHFLHTILSQMQIPHMSISIVPNNTIDSYTLQMQTSSDSFSLALRDLIDHFGWGFEHDKLVFLYEKHTSRREFFYLNTRKLLCLRFGTSNECFTYEK